MFTAAKKIWFQITHWETWHYLAKYVPIAPVWLWYCCRARSFWFFTASNPTLTFGGFEGERKMEMYEQLPLSSYPKTICIQQPATLQQLMGAVDEHHFTYPLMVKPDVGMMGLMCRKIEHPQQLHAYHNIMQYNYLVQEYVAYPIEVSVFYYRYPNEQNGTITGFIRKEFLEVTGDGISTLVMLIDRYDRAKFRKGEMRNKHMHQLNNVIAAGEKYCLSPALNLSRGGKLVSLEQEIDGPLLALFDGLSHYTRQFYYGRYDVKCASIEQLKQGKEFCILEYNGSGAEPHHIYGNGNTLLQAYRIVLQHWKVLYRISKQNREKGILYWKHDDGKRFLKKARQYFALLKRLDLQMPV